MSDEKQENTANESGGVYGNGKITFYKSFEEENEAKIAYYASLSPLECLKQLNALLRQVYGEEFSDDKKLGTKIYFD
jgi:hypothetical protein